MFPSEPSPPPQPEESISPPTPEGTAPVPASFPVVGVGASAGGLEALSQLLSHLPAQAGLALVLVQHLEPHHASLLPEILAKVTPLPVHEAQDGMVVEKDHVYVMPPSTTMTFTQHKLALAPRLETEKPHMPIDHFLRTLAAEMGSLAGGVLLSGGGTDGTLGMQAIKGQGGFCFAQDDSAQFPSMPRSAVAQGWVDAVLSPADIAGRLVQITRHPYVAQPQPSPGLLPANSDGLKRIFQLLQSASGVDFSRYKTSTVQRRIQRRMALLDIERLEAFVAHLQTHPEAVQALHQDLLICVTSFFRDADAFEALQQTVLPRLIQGRPAGEALRVWVAGCSTGEEVYSVAIALLEVLGDMAANTPIKILATDVSTTALEQARAGIFLENIELDVSPDRLRRFFTRIDATHYQVCKAIRDLCVFSRHDLTRDPPFSHLDLVTCRNVLIYLDLATQRRVFPVLHYALTPDGYLMLGKSEGIGTFQNLFEPVDESHKLFRRKETLDRLPFDFAFADAGNRPQRDAAAAGLPSRPITSADLVREADRTLMARYVPAGILVDAHLTVLQFRGDLSPYLEPMSGAASLNLLRLLRTSLHAPVQAALAAAQEQNAPIRRVSIPFKDRGQIHTVQLEVLPVRSVVSGDRSYWVLFQEPPSRPGQPEERAPQKEEVVPGNDQQQVRHLQDELDSSRTYIQTLREDHEAVTQELKSAHEELISSNEELQNTNEELQTSKEEMQSANEELVTLNEELKHRNGLLHALNDDLINLLGGLNVPIVMVSGDLRLRRFNPQAETVFNLILSDIGRPITDIRHNLTISDLEQVLTEVSSRLVPQEQEVQDRAGRWYSLRVRPYITVEKKIDGATIVVVDIDELKRKANRELEQAQLLNEEQQKRAEAELANRVKDEFLAMLSHELRNPLAPLLTNVEILRLQVGDRPEVRKALDIMERQLTHMTRLLGDLLDVSRLLHGKIHLYRERLELAAVVASAVETVRPLIEQRNQQFTVRLPDTPVWLDGDLVRLTEVFSNLLNNANKYTDPGGEIALTASQEGAQAVVRVRDTGVGINPELLPRVFELFTQADRSLDRAQGGLGLGLTLVRRLVEIHGGKVAAFSAGLGKGSEFVVRLPVAAAPAPRSEAGATRAAGQASPGRRLLIVDDNHDVAESLAMMLRLLGHEVQTASSGAAALQAAPAFRPEIVLLDIGLPGMDGYEVARQLRQVPGLEDVRLVALTGYGQDEDRRRSREAGIDLHLVKPVEAEALQKLLTTSLRS